MKRRIYLAIGVILLIALIFFIYLNQENSQNLALNRGEKVRNYEQFASIRVETASLSERFAQKQHEKMIVLLVFEANEQLKKANE